MAGQTPVGVAPGSYADQLFELLQEIKGAVQCRNQPAQSRISTVTLIPVGSPGTAGVLVVPPDPARLGFVMFNLDPTSIIYLSPQVTFEIPETSASLVGTGCQPLFPKTGIAYTFQEDQDVGLPWYALAGGFPAMISVTLVK
ncbi:MAG: hypothetical protein ACREN4_09720 [Candidatus Dormibacteria bacterium]